MKRKQFSEKQIIGILKAEAGAVVILTRWIDDYSTEWPHSSLGHPTPAAFAAALEKQRAGLNPSVASPALLRDHNGRALVAAG